MKARESKSLVTMIQDEIIKLIKNNNLNADDQIPSEPELTHMLNVSRSSVREALANLTQEGVVYKIQGKGTFLRAKPYSLNNGIDTLFSVTEAINNCGATPNTSRISIEKILPSPLIAQTLNITESEACYMIKRVRKADDTVAVYNINIFPVAILGEKIAEQDLQGSLFSYLESVGHIVSHAKSNIKPTVLTSRELPDLDSQIGVFLLFDEVYYNTKGEIIGCTNDYYNSDVFDFNIIRKRLII